LVTSTSGSVTLDHAVGEVGVAELGERLVADRQGPAGQVLRGGHREVPGEVEVLAVDAEVLHLVEQVVHLGGTILVGTVRRVTLSAVAVPGEDVTGGDVLAGTRPSARAARPRSGDRG
jgi:hypothetical protein